MIVDDDRAGADALAAVLAIEGFRATVVEGGRQALRTPPTFKPHIVVLDIEMPLCDGFAVATAMRESACFAAVPIIGYSSLDEAEVVERGKQAQIDAFCRKGNTLHCLFELIEFMAPVGPAST
ncbi:response regulator [Caballeronia sp. AZ7_KS35]|uniref:response regulator n=1 Tax=Caballeronia sp. AZ7_KS35 TaxID=2921762 RepID=UPI002027A749|nr:response regulator [Caballeronia sp. AZ7_KS35]